MRRALLGEDALHTGRPAGRRPAGRRPAGRSRIIYRDSAFALRRRGAGAGYAGALAPGHHARDPARALQPAPRPRRRRHESAARGDGPPAGRHGPLSRRHASRRGRAREGVAAGGQGSAARAGRGGRLSDGTRSRGERGLWTN